MRIGAERHAAVRALHDHAADPGDWLPRLLGDEACALAARCGRTDVAGHLHRLAEDGEFRAAEALCTLGLPLPEASEKDLKNRALQGELSALRALVHADPAPGIRVWLSSLLDLPDTAPIAVRGAGMLGDRSVLPWLIRQMRNPALALPPAARSWSCSPRRWKRLTTSSPTTPRCSGV